MSFRSVLGAALMLALAVAPAKAAVTISFYAHQLGSRGMWVEFPHAYVTLVGTADAGGPPVKTNFGFTPPVVGPSILLGRVEGVVIGADDAYVAKDQPYFSFALSDRQYAAVLAVAERWRNYPQPSYDLDTHNCVTFVKEVAEAVGLATSDDASFVRDPAAFLADVKLRNSGLLAQLNRRLAGAASPGRAAAAAP